MSEPTGIYNDIEAARYHADGFHHGAPTLSASVAKILLDQSPAHARAAHPRLNPNYEQKAEDKYDVGTACHKLLLEGQSAVDVIPFDDYRTKPAQEAKALARSYGRVPLLLKHAEEVERMVASVTEQIAGLNIAPIPLTDGVPEQTIVWNDQGVSCRGRIDWLLHDNSQIHDVKTTSRIGHPAGWMRGALYDHGCDLQAAAYIRGVRAVTGVTPEFRWILIETAPPFAVSVIAPEASVLAIGDAKWERALELWKRCLAEDDWPAYGRDLHWADLPPYIESRWLERQAREELQAA
jgi:hypothetical protein